MKRIILFAFLFLLAFSARATDLHGPWTATRADQSAGRIQLELSYGGHNHFGQSFETTLLPGLSDAQIASTTQTPVTFELRREAGVIAFRGFFEHGEGAGHFTFTPNPGFFRTVESMGVHVAADRRRDEDLLSLAILDVSTEFIRGMRAEGYDVGMDEYTSMRIFRVTRELIAEYRRLGYDKIAYDSLIAMRVHRVTPDYIDKMRAAGYSKLSLDELVTSRIHRATPEFISELRAAGYSGLSFEDLVNFRIHRVTPELIRELRDLGYDHLTADQLVEMRIHGVTPEYIRNLKSAGYSRVPVDKLVEMRIHGIDAEIVKKMR